MNIVVIETLPIQYRASPVFVLLVIDPRLGQVRTVYSARDLVDGDKRWLNGDKGGSAVRIIWIGVFRDFQAIRSPIAVCIDTERIGAGVIGIDESPGAGLDSIKQAVAVSVGICWISSGSLLLPIIGSIIVYVRLGRIGPVDILIGIVDAIFVKVTGTQLGEIPGEELLLVSVRDAVSIAVDIGIKVACLDYKVVDEEVLVGTAHTG